MILDAEPGGLIEIRHGLLHVILECVDLGSVDQRLAIALIELERVDKLATASGKSRSRQCSEPRVEKA